MTSWLRSWVTPRSASGRVGSPPATPGMGNPPPDIVAAVTQESPDMRTLEVGNTTPAEGQRMPSYAELAGPVQW